jgi:RNA polymerase sigma-70 factor (ECF subfamily)
MVASPPRLVTLSGATRRGDVSQDDPSDEALMARYVERDDRAAFRLLFDRYAARLTAYFRRTTGTEDATDLVQTTFLHLHRARRDFRSGQPLRPWLFTIAANVRRDHFRRKGRRPAEGPLEQEIPVAPAASTSTDRVVQRALEQLPDGQREVLVLRWYADLSYPEIATALGATHSAIKVRAHRAMQQLRALLGGDDGR